MIGTNSLAMPTQRTLSSLAQFPLELLIAATNP